MPRTTRHPPLHWSSATQRRGFALSASPSPSESALLYSSREAAQMRHGDHDDQDQPDESESEDHGEPPPCGTTVEDYTRTENARPAIAQSRRTPRVPSAGREHAVSRCACWVVQRASRNSNTALRTASVWTHTASWPAPGIITDWICGATALRRAMAACGSHIRSFSPTT